MRCLFPTACHAWSLTPFVLVLVVVAFRKQRHSTHTIAVKELLRRYPCAPRGSSLFFKLRLCRQEDVTAEQEQPVLDVSLSTYHRLLFSLVGSFVCRILINKDMYITRGMFKRRSDSYRTSRKYCGAFSVMCARAERKEKGKGIV